MEAILFNDQVGFISPTRSSATCDNSKLWLGLTNDCKNFVKKDDFDFTDLLHSPDFNITSPNVESLFLKSLESPPALKAACLSPVFQQQDSCRLETCATTLQEAVTKEQEIFAQGFTDALEKIQRREEATKDDNTPQRVEKVSSGENQEDAVDNSRYCFISYKFDSCKPLPPFHEAFSSFIAFSAEERPLRRGHESVADPSQDCVFWDKIETLDEGFSVHALTGSLQRLTSPTQDSCDDDSDASITSPTLPSPDNELFDFPSEMEDDVFRSCSSNLEERERTSSPFMTRDLAMQKQWLAHQCQNGRPESMQVGFDFQGFKMEHEKRSIYLKACQQEEKLPEDCLETAFKLLCTENAQLQRQLDKFKRKRQRLQKAFNANYSDCSQMQVQLNKTGLSLHDKDLTSGVCLY